jgi:hypothetical protein
MTSDARPGLVDADGENGAEWARCAGPCAVCLPFADVLDAAWLAAIRADLATDRWYVTMTRDRRRRVVA